MAASYVLDTSLLLGGREPPQGAGWYTTPEAASEVSPGGRDAKRYQNWIALGLRVQRATDDGQDDVESVARAAGNLSRLSPADRSLLALTLDLGADATLLTDDHTMLDVAKRLKLRTRTLNTEGIQDTLDWKPRCSGCGRWFDDMPKREECPICGSAVRSKPFKAGSA